jgi:uncharacterized integral membrane protein
MPATESVEHMQFLKTLMWVLLAVAVALFASRNWFAVTLSLWGDIEADIKLPVLLFLFFLAGFLPTWLVLRARLWSVRRRVEAMERSLQPVEPVPAPATAPIEEPAL